LALTLYDYVVWSEVKYRSLRGGMTRAVIRFVEAKATYIPVVTLYGYRAGSPVGPRWCPSRGSGGLSLFVNWYTNFDVL